MEGLQVATQTLLVSGGGEMGSVPTPLDFILGSGGGGSVRVKASNKRGRGGGGSVPMPLDIARTTALMLASCRWGFGGSGGVEGAKASSASLLLLLLLLEPLQVASLGGRREGEVHTPTSLPSTATLATPAALGRGAAAAEATATG